VLPGDVRDEIGRLVRGAYDTREDIVEIICEELHTSAESGEPRELDPAEAAAAVDAAFAAHAAEQATWHDVTDCDRLTAAFARLNAGGIIALECAGFTLSDGYADCGEAYHQHPDPASVRGYCFFHYQDVERALAGDGLALAFGPLDPEEEAEGIAVGEAVRDELERAGFGVTWDGTFAQRILVPKIVWRKRR
jgi:hypothetical protein